MASVQLEPVAASTMTDMAVSNVSVVESGYEWGELLGSGSFGTVRVAIDKETGSQYAVKILPLTSEGKNKLNAINREVKMLERLAGCPSVVRLERVFRDWSNVYIVQELMHGGDLQTLLEVQEHLEEDEAVAVFHGVLTSLAACHKQNILYGDVKPANFLVQDMYPSIQHIIDPSRPKGRLVVKMADFGCSQLCGEQGQASISGLTGTPAFLAPEVLDGQYGLAADMWAAGVLLYQLVTGKLPFWEADIDTLQRVSPKQILIGIMEGDIEADKAMWDTFSPELADLLRGLLNRDPEERLTAIAALQHPFLKLHGL